MRSRKTSLCREKAKRIGSSPSNANRDLALVWAILRRAERVWDWTDRAPSLPMYPEPKRRIRSVTPEQVPKAVVPASQS